MWEQQLKAVCQLHRLIILLSATFALQTLWPIGPTWWAKGAFLLALTAAVFSLMANEFILKLAKKFRDAPPQTMTMMSLSLPLAASLYSDVMYGLSGNMLAFWTGLLTLMSPYLLGRPALVPILALQFGVVLALSHLVNFPKALQLTAAAPWVGSLLLGGSLIVIGQLVYSLLKNHIQEVGKLQSMAVTDALTGLTNRRQFNARLHEEVARARRHETPLTLALFDLDDFKRINDFYGHQVGDRILKEMGGILKQNLRESDLPARYGGEEFALILPETREKEGAELLERIRKLVAQTVFCLPENPMTVHISVGLAQLDPKKQTAFELVELADKALYEAKRQGKNQVVEGSALLSKVLIEKDSIQRLFSN